MSRAPSSMGNAAAKIPWRDLLPLSIREKIFEATLPLPWLALSLWSYEAGWWWLALIASFYFFLTGLRQSHGAQHYSLGIPRWMQDSILFVLSVVMFGSMHSVQASHLHHHRHCLEETDMEGSTARLPGWLAILTGPLFLIRLHRAAWQVASSRQRKWIIAELLTLVGAGLASPWMSIAWGCHFSAMLAGECLTGFFAVWTVHHHCDPEGLFARTQRGRWVNLIFYGMFYHTEHHLFPAVPTCRLGRLAARLDAAAPIYSTRQVIPWALRQLRPMAFTQTTRIV
jgi:fatty acid desaturase